MSKGITYRGDHLTQIAMPMGGIGAGSICLNGVGGLHDFSIRNRPATTALPDSWHPDESGFALLHIKGRKPVTKLVEGAMPKAWVYDRGLQAQGFRKGGQDGLPRFKHAKFKSEYPFGTVKLKDDQVPLAVSITGWSPFIPLDDRNSGLPCAIVEYTLKNTSRKTVAYEFSYHVSHWAQGVRPDKSTRTRLIENGVELFNTEAPETEKFGSVSLSVIGATPKIKASWFRGGWFDGITALWRECSEGRFTTAAPAETDIDGRNGASILLAGKLKAGESVTYPIVITWYFPNVYWSAGNPAEKDVAKHEHADERQWQPWYSTQWKDAGDVAAHVHANFDSLARRTTAFKDALFDNTLPPVVTDAIASNLAILKSPTIVREANGNLWGWEGCFTTRGSCHGSCTHVWNYAQALPHLFPQLERNLREAEYLRSMDDRGHVNFRTPLPDVAPDHGWHAAADGQLGGILKLWRDYSISGDLDWLKKMYPLAKRSLDYCSHHWDPEQKGVLVEPHHNTYDIEFWGPDGMCTSVYLGALQAMAKLADAVGDADHTAHCRSLANAGAVKMDRDLFNGEYYDQKVQWKNLQASAKFNESLENPEMTPATRALLTKEGPKYQYGKGCLSDGVIGAWMAALYGVELPLDQKKITSHLKSVMKYNFRDDLSDHPNCQRPGYAIGDEAGLLLCTWPHGEQLTLPFPYADEVWTGIEYQVASHLILAGQVKDGLALVKAVRSRYDGLVRNPFNEYECGSYYARAMASYSLLQSLTGFTYSAVDKTIRLAPKLPGRLKTFFSTATAFGSITLAKEKLSIDAVEGELLVDAIVIGTGKKSRTIEVGTTLRAGEGFEWKLSAKTAV